MLIVGARARLDRYSNKTSSETLFIIDNLCARAGIIPVNMRPWDDNDDQAYLKSLLQPCLAKVRYTRTDQPANPTSLTGGTSPALFTVTLPDLNAKCEALAFWSILDIVNEVLLTERTQSTDVSQHDILYTGELPASALDAANAWRARLRSVREMINNLQREISELYPQSEVCTCYVLEALLNIL